MMSSLRQHCMNGPARYFPWIGRKEDGMREIRAIFAKTRNKRSFESLPRRKSYEVTYVTREPVQVYIWHDYTWCNVADYANTVLDARKSIEEVRILIPQHSKAQFIDLWIRARRILGKKNVFCADQDFSVTRETFLGAFSRKKENYSGNKKSKSRGRMDNAFEAIRLKLHRM